MKKSVLFLLVAQLLGVAAFAQGPGQGDGPRDGNQERGNPQEIIVNYFGFDETQQEGFSALLEDRQEQSRVLSEQIHAIEQTMRELSASESPDATAIGEQVLARKALQEERAGLGATFAEGFQNLLDDSQSEQFGFLIEAANVRPVVNAAGRLGLLRPPSEE